MAKSDRHKKLRRKEKAKTQLTGVKKLARPQNIIEPTFKARKIIIREQLQGPGEGDVVQVSRNKSLQVIIPSVCYICYAISSLCTVVRCVSVIGSLVFSESS